MNKRGNIAFNLLPVIALVLFTAALFAFLNLDNNFQDKSGEFANLISDLSIMRQYVESSAKVIIFDCVRQGCSAANLRDISMKHDLHIKGQGNFFSQIDEGNFVLSRVGESVILEVPEVFIQSRQGNHFAESTFDLIIEVNNQGEFTRFINK